MIKGRVFLGLALAGCAYRGPPVTWVETSYHPPVHATGAKVFFVDRQYDVGDCVLRPGGHVLVSQGGSGNVGLGLSTRSRQAGRWLYGVTLLAADGTTLAHHPLPDGRVYLQRIPAGAPGFVGGTDFPVPRDVYDRVTRVLIHARC